MLFSIEEDEEARILSELMASKKVIGTSREPLWFEYPKAEDILYAEYIFKTYYDKLKSDGVPTLEQAYEEHEKLGLWNAKDEETLKKLPGFIDETITQIERERNRGRKKKYEHWLKQLQRKFAELYGAKMELFSNSVELIANRYANSYLVYRCFRTVEGNKLCDTYEELLNDWSFRDYIDDLILIVHECLELMNIKLLRKLARSGGWRVRWNVSKKNIRSLFNRSMADLTPNQLMLVYWSQVYDNAYESMERPPDDVIEDDAALDDWFKREAEKRNREISQRYHGKKSSASNNPKISNAPEIYKVVAGYFDENGEYRLYSDDERWDQIERIRELNAPETRAVQRMGEAELLKEPGQFKPEQKLRKTERQIEAMGAKLEVRKR